MSQPTTFYGGLQVRPNPNSGTGSESAITQAKVTIPAARVKTLKANPYELVPAPGAGYVLELVALSLFLDFTAPAMATIADAQVFYGSTGGQAASQVIVMTGFLNSVFDAVTFARASPDAAFFRTQVENKALAFANVGAAEYSAGNSSLLVEATYRVHRPAFW